MKTAQIVLALVWMTLGLACPEDAGKRYKGQTLRLFNWEEYIDPKVLRLFEKEFRVTVTEDNYASNEDLLAKLQAGATGYDVVVPSCYMVAHLVKAGLLLELDHANIPNLKNIAARFLDPPYDPGNRYSVPYLWGVTGIGYSKTKVKPPPESWSDILTPDRIGRYRNRISMLEDLREVVGAALILLGESPNTTDPAALEKARSLLRAQKPFLAKFDSESYEDSLAAGEIVLAQGWNGEMATAQSENADIGFVVPKEGTLLFVDNFAIPKSAPNKRLAEEFIDFVLRPKMSARIVNTVNYATANDAAREFIDPKILKSPVYEIPENVKLWRLEGLGESLKLYDRIWTELKAE